MLYKLLVEGSTAGQIRYYELKAVIKNEGNKVVNKFKLISDLIGPWKTTFDDEYLVQLPSSSNGFLEKMWPPDLSDPAAWGIPQTIKIIYRPIEVLFPQEEVEVAMGIGYKDEIVDDYPDEMDWRDVVNEKEFDIRWSLFADDMPQLTGWINLSDLDIEILTW